MKAEESPAQAPAGPRGLGALAAVTGLWTFGVALSAPFLDAYLWTLHASWVILGLFNLAQYLAMVFTFPVAGRLARRRGARLPLRAAAVAVAAALILTLILGVSAPHHVVAIGLALGIGWGLYWLAQFVFSIDLTRRGEGRDRWQSLAGALDTGSGLVAPLIAGAIAAAGDWAGFRGLLLVTLGVLLLAALLTSRLPAGSAATKTRVTEARRTGWLPGLLGAAAARRDAPLARNRARASGSSTLGPASAARDERSLRIWRHILQAHAVLAVRDGAYLFAPALLVYVVSGSTLDLGAFLAATKGASLLAYAVLGRWGGPARRRPAMLAGSALSVAAGATLALGLSQPVLWVFGLLIAALGPCLSVPLESCTLDVIALLAGDAGGRVDRTVAKEVAVNAARVVGVGAMVVTVAFLGAGAVRWWLVAVAPLPWVAWLAMRAVPVAAPQSPAR